MYYGHSAPSKACASNPQDQWEPLQLHVRSVAERAATYAEFARDEVYAAGLLHDLGKYTDLFTQRLQGLPVSVDHWTSGATAALMRYRTHALSMALAIEGHHHGLQSLATLHHMHQAGRSKYQIPERNVDVLLARLHADGLVLPDATTVVTASPSPVAAPDYLPFMVSTRMLYSALVDADFIETEAHFRSVNGQRYERPASLPLDPTRALALLSTFVSGLSASGSEEIRALRSALRRVCLGRADDTPGLFTLSAPTGLGKTLAMMAFALRHAEVYGLRRIVMVVPYLSIIEQTAKTLQTIFAPLRVDGRPYILEHHSIAQPSAYEGDMSAPATENWDAPIVITTNVQFLESLFSNRSSSCRKLHRLYRSVVLMDEVQSLPTKLVDPTLATLNEMASAYQMTTVMSTATQPPFAMRSTLPGYTPWSRRAWAPREIAEAGMFDSLPRRYTTTWDATARTIDDIAQALVQQPQVLCVVNTRRMAHCLFRAVRAHEATAVYHLSTTMCASHRKHLLAVVGRLLASGQRVILVSTQCIEAGVDVDFPVVYREAAPLDSLVQAAGRCNRHGVRPSGDVIVFRFKEGQIPNLWPSMTYRAMTEQTLALVAQHGGRLDLDDTRHLDQFYRYVYANRGGNDQKPALDEAIRKSVDFVATSDNYNIIDAAGVHVLVPYAAEAAQYAKLRRVALNATKAPPMWWHREAQMLMVQVPKKYIDGMPASVVGDTKDWLVCDDVSWYYDSIGLSSPDDIIGDSELEQPL